MFRNQKERCLMWVIRWECRWLVREELNLAGIGSSTEVLGTVWRIIFSTNCSETGVKQRYRVPENANWLSLFFCSTREELIKNDVLTPSLTQPVKFPGWKCTHTRLQTIYLMVLQNPTFNTVNFHRNALTWSHEGGKKVLMVSLNLAILWLVFQVTERRAWQWKG